jgi:hypothetical protein
MRDPQKQLSRGWTRYCVGGAMAVRLGSMDLLNTIVVAHPLNLTRAQIRAIKVTIYSIPPEVSPIPT